jgi:hypothetical protein
MTRKLIESIEEFSKKHSLSIFVLPSLSDTIYWIVSVAYKYLNLQLPIGTSVSFCFEFESFTFLFPIVMDDCVA